MTDGFVEKGDKAWYGEGYCTDLETIRRLEYPLLNGILPHSRNFMAMLIIVLTGLRNYLS